MSGGHFDYAQYQIEQIADQLRRDIKNNDKENDFGYKYGFSPLTLSKLCVCADIIEAAAKLANAVDWLYSGDDGEETFAEKYQTEMEGLFGDSAKKLLEMFNEEK